MTVAVLVRSTADDASAAVVEDVVFLVDVTAADAAVAGAVAPDAEAGYVSLDAAAAAGNAVDDAGQVVGRTVKRGLGTNAVAGASAAAAAGTVQPFVSFAVAKSSLTSGRHPRFCPRQPWKTHGY